jgi:hypothetical protein
MVNKFKKNDTIKHRKGGEYFILSEPDHRKLEYCNEPYYVYKALIDDSVWVRRKSEMEDGRFNLVKGLPVLKSCLYALADRVLPLIVLPLTAICFGICIVMFVYSNNIQ